MIDSELEEEMDVDDPEPEPEPEPEPVDDLDLILGNNREGGEGGFISDNDNNDIEGDANPPDGAADGEANGTTKEIKKKRVIRNPQPKLNYHVLTGSRGIGAIKEVFADIQLKGKGHELSDLNRIMTKLEYWTHRLFPRYSFDEVLDRIEKLGRKRPVEVYLKRMRQGMEDVINPVSREFIEEEPPSPPPPPQESLDDVFDSLLPTEPPIVPTPPPKPRVEITAEQRERMERNRQQALEKRLARIEAQKEEERRKASQNAAGSPPSENSDQPCTSTSNLESEILETNFDSENRDGNLFESSQEVFSINKLTGSPSKVPLPNLNESADGTSENVPNSISDADVPEVPEIETELDISHILDGTTVNESRFDQVTSGDNLDTELINSKINE